MAKLIDLTGQKFDKILILEKAPSRNRHVYWKCQCDCGNTCEISGESLRRDIPHDCGCVKQQRQLQKQQELKLKQNWLVGKKFGKLTVISKTDERINNGVVWVCQCDCGNTKKVPTHLLTSGHTRSCGCLVREVQGIDIAGQKFGKLTALYPCDYKLKQTIIWHCQCECGNECDIDGSNLRLNLTKSCGCISSSIGEDNIQKILQNNSIKYKKEYVIKEIGNLRFDFAILDNEKIIRLIEFDGIQHFTSSTGAWNNYQDNLQKRQERDNRKNEWAKNNNIPLVRIPYWERDKITLEMIMGEKYLI